MQDIHNSSLFTEITPEEEITVQGGLPPLLVASLAGGAASWALSKVEGIWLNTNGRRGAEFVGGVYGPDGGNKGPRDQGQLWEIQWWGNTYNGYGNTILNALLFNITKSRLPIRIRRT
jgi:hypothetical protein